MPTVVNPSVSPGTAAATGRAREWALTTAAAVALAIVMTWPLAARLQTAARVDSTDGMYAMWNVATVARALTSDPRGVFDTNIFHPHRGTLAYSESNIGAGAIAAPAWLLTRDVYATYNVAVLASFILSFLCTYALARRLTGDRVAAAAAAMAFAYAPYLYARIPHIQLLMTFGMPLALLALHRLVDRPSVLNGVLLGAALAVAALSSAYYGILIGLAVGLGVVVYGVWLGLWRERAYWLAVAVALVALLLFMLPFVPPYMAIRQEGFERTLEEARRYSVDWRGWLASPVRTHGWLLIEGFRGVAFPGVTRVVFGLAGLGLLLGSARCASRFARGRAHAVFYTLVGVLTFWATLGPQAGLYTLLHNTIPVFAFMRAVERFAILVTLVLAIGVGFAIGLMRPWMAQHGRRWMPAAAVALFAAIAADSWAAPLVLRDALPVPSAYRALARAPRGAIAEFPFYRRLDFHAHAYYMLMSTYHWQPMINGYSDHYPAGFTEMADVLYQFPLEPAAFTHLQRHDVRYVIVHLNRMHPQRRPHVAQGLAHYVAQGVLRLVQSDTDVAMYEIVRYPS